MIWFFTPYSFEKKLFEAYDNYMGLIKDPDDWGCLMDGDMAFLMSDFGNQIQAYIDKYPNTGLFISYASRSPYGHQMIPGTDCESDSIRYIYENTLKARETDDLKVVRQTSLSCGPILIIKKITWDKYRQHIKEQSANANIQSIDTAISNILTKNGETTLLMAGLQVYHYFRHYNFSEKHILSDKLSVVIRTHDRPEMFKRCIESVRNQTHKNIDIIVGVDTPGSFTYAKKYKPTKIIKCTPRDNVSATDFPANEYISHLMEEINDGFILILDDDNFIADPQGVEKLFKQIDKEWCIYMIRYRYPDGRLFPDNRQFRSKKIENGGVDWASHVFHSRFKNVSKSKPLYNADYYWIKNMVSRVKTTKWINLDLVHTDTPANKGKTEKEMIALNDPKRTHDVVYVLGTGSNWDNNEIRFSIRSFVKYFENLRNIVVVGECPPWLTDVIHIPTPDRMDVNKDARMAIKILSACKDCRVSDNFILSLDDEILLKPLKAEDFKGWHEGPIIYDVAADEKDHRGTTPYTTPYSSEWFNFVYNTGRELQKRGLPDNNYDKAHCPQPINKAEFIEVIEKWNIVDNRYTISNIYNNSSKTFVGENIRGRHLKIYGELPIADIIELADDKYCMNFNDRGLTPQLKDWLYKTFSQPSRFETFSTEKSRREIVEKWFAEGCDYEQGTAIFQNFASKNRILQRYFATKHSEQTERKLKYTLQLWLR